MTDADRTAIDETLFEAWQSFRELLDHHTVITPTILEVLRNAFYCGSAATLTMVYDAAARPDGAERIDALTMEVHAFKYDLRSTGGTR